jgi:DNA-binding NtrC family response regulator
MIMWPFTVRSAVRVLVVDDEPLIRWSVAETLGQNGYFVAEAGTEAEAVERASDPLPFDVILLDLRLPDSTTLDLLQYLREASPASRVIMMTAYGTPAIAAECARLGSFAFLGKPFELTELVALVDAAA